MSTLYEEVLLTKMIVYALEELSTLGNRFIYTMEKINFWYSMKNIGIPQNKTYLLQLIEKIEMVVKIMRWNTLRNGKKETNGIKTEWDGHKSSKTPNGMDTNPQKHRMGWTQILKNTEWDGHKSSKTPNGMDTNPQKHRSK